MIVCQCNKTGGDDGDNESYEKYIVSPELSTRSETCAYHYPTFISLGLSTLHLIFLAAVGIERAMGASADNFTLFSNNDSLKNQFMSRMRRRTLENDSTSDREMALNK